MASLIRLRDERLTEIRGWQMSELGPKFGREIIGRGEEKVVDRHHCSPWRWAVTRLVQSQSRGAHARRLQVLTSKRKPIRKHPSSKENVEEVEADSRMHDGR